MTSKFLITVIFFVTAACTSTQETPPPVSTPLPDSRTAGGSYIHQDQYENIRHQENLKAYTLGRYVDPADTSVMHEQGVIYRVENSSSWNLQPEVTPSELPFGGSGTSQQSDNPALLKAEIEVKANEQRALYQYLKNAADKASGQIDILQESTGISRKLLEQNKALRKKLEQSEKEKKLLNENLFKLKKQVGILLKLYRQKEAETIRSKYRREK